MVDPNITPLRSTPPEVEARFRQQMAERLDDIERRRVEVASRVDAGLAAISRLVDIANGDTGQSRRVADFLLSWWNAETCGGFDLTDVWGVDATIADDMVTAFRFIADHNGYPTAHGFGPSFERLVTEWRPRLARD